MIAHDVLIFLPLILAAGAVCTYKINRLSGALFFVSALVHTIPVIVSVIGAQPQDFLLDVAYTNALLPFFELVSFFFCVAVLLFFKDYLGRLFVVGALMQWVASIALYCFEFFWGWGVFPADFFA